MGRARPLSCLWPPLALSEMRAHIVHTRGHIMLKECLKIHPANLSHGELHVCPISGPLVPEHFRNLCLLARLLPGFVYALLFNC